MKRPRGRRPSRPSNARADIDRTPVDPTIGHVPVLMRQVLEVLDPQPGQTMLDLTVGRGGHAVELGRRVGAGGTIVGVDLDEDNLRFAETRVGNETDCRFIGLHAPFSDVPASLANLGVTADGMLADLGFASTQIDDPQRGLSFSAEGPLDMRFDRTAPTTAADLLARLPERELAEMLRHLGEEPKALKIARAIVRRRQADALPATTSDLAELVAEVYGPRARHSRLHPATRTFMALRIAVNDELNRLASLLGSITNAAESAAEIRSVDIPCVGEDCAKKSEPWLRSGAAVAIISFHSLEDRLVKHAFVAMARAGTAERITRKPQIADEAEVAGNPRSRSAKLRAVRIGPADGGADRRGSGGLGDEDDSDDSM